jgi:hypothetical protein
MAEDESGDDLVVGRRSKKRRTLADSEDEELSRMEEDLQGEGNAENDSNIEKDDEESFAEKSDISFSDNNEEDEDFDSPISEEDDDDEDWMVSAKKKKNPPMRQSGRIRKAVSYSYNDDEFEEDIENYENSSSKRKKARQGLNYSFCIFETFLNLFKPK